MKSLDLIEQEKQEQEAAAAALAEIQKAQPADQSQQPEDQSQQPDGQPDSLPEENDGERLFSMAEVRRIVDEAVRQERVNIACREYLLAHYYNVAHVSDEIDRLLRILSPRSVDELAEKLGEIEGLDVSETAGAAHRVGTSSLKMKTSLRSIFTQN